MERKKSTIAVMHKLCNIISLNPSKLAIVKNNLSLMDESQLSDFEEKYASLTINTDMSNNHNKLFDIMSEKTQNNDRTCKEYNNYDRIENAFPQEEEYGSIKKAF